MSSVTPFNPQSFAPIGSPIGQPTDIEIIQSIFRNPDSTKSFLDGFRPAIFGGAICGVLLLPFVSHLINKCGCDKEMFVIGIKILLFIIIFYLFEGKIRA
jgi:hypothetical protein